MTYNLVSRSINAPYRWDKKRVWKGFPYLHEIGQYANVLGFSVATATDPMAYFFVGGSQRAGTTLLQTILCQGDTTNPFIREAKYLRSLLAAYRLGKQLYDHETTDYFDSLEAYRAFNAGIVNGLLKKTLDKYTPAQHLVLREPHLSIFFPELYELIPDVRFICIMRDPRDTIASMIKVGKKMGSQGIKDDVMAQLFQSRNIQALCRHFKSFYFPVLHAADPGFKRSVLFVRYEDLVKSPAEVIEKVVQFTGLALPDIGPGRDFCTGTMDFDQTEAYQKTWTTEHYGKPISESRVGQYRELLAAPEIAAIERDCQDILHDFYTVEDGTPRP